MAGSGSAGVDVENSGGGLSEFVRSGVEELTGSGGSGSRILDAEEGTDIGVAAEAYWLKRAVGWSSVAQASRAIYQRRS